MQLRRKELILTVKEIKPNTTQHYFDNWTEKIPCPTDKKTNKTTEHQHSLSDILWALSLSLSLSVSLPPVSLFPLPLLFFSSLSFFLYHLVPLFLHPLAKNNYCYEDMSNQCTTFLTLFLFLRRDRSIACQVPYLKKKKNTADSHANGREC